MSHVDCYILNPSPRLYRGQENCNLQFLTPPNGLVYCKLHFFPPPKPRLRGRGSCHNLSGRKRLLRMVGITSRCPHNRKLKPIPTISQPLGVDSINFWLLCQNGWDCAFGHPSLSPSIVFLFLSLFRSI